MPADTSAASAAISVEYIRVRGPQIPQNCWQRWQMYWGRRWRMPAGTGGGGGRCRQTHPPHLWQSLLSISESEDLQFPRTAGGGGGCTGGRGGRCWQTHPPHLQQSLLSISESEDLQFPRTDIGISTYGDLWYKMGYCTYLSRPNLPKTRKQLFWDLCK